MGRAAVAIGAAGLLLSAALAPNSAGAQSSQDWRRCASPASRGEALALKIRSCTAIIAATGETPRNKAAAYNNRGNAYQDGKDLDHAIADFDAAIRLRPDYALAYSNRGNAYSRRKDYTRAIASYDEAIRIDPNQASAYNNRCFALAASGGDLQQAIRDCDAALMLRPGFACALGSRGFAHFRAGDLDAALVDLDAALKADAKAAPWLYLRGVVRLRRGDRAAADADIAAAKAIQPDIADEYGGYGIMPEMPPPRPSPGRIASCGA